MNWKQPIPTNLDAVFGDDFLSQDIYIWVLLHASNTERTVSLNGKIISLQRGQCYATITYLARRFGKNEKTIKKYLNLLNTLHDRLEHDSYPQGVVITVKSYDEIVKMENGLENSLDSEWRTTTERLPTNKNDKSEKNDISASTEFSVKDIENLQVLDGIPADDISFISEKYHVSENQVFAVLEKLKKWVYDGKQKGLIKDASKTLDQWVDRAVNEFGSIKPKKSIEQLLEEETGHPVD